MDLAKLQFNLPPQSWVKAHASYLGATDIAAILGIHRYMTPLGVWLEKTGREQDWELRECMIHGQNLEPYVAKLYSASTDRKLKRSKLYRDPLCNFFGATPDYEVVGEKRLVECKTAGHWAGQIFGDEADALPDEYLVQCMWQLAVVGRPTCDLAVLIGGQRFKLYCVDRDEELISYLREVARAWWENYVIPQVEPPLTGHAPDTEYVKRAHPIDAGDILYATPELDEVCLGLQKAKGQTTAAKLEEERLTNEIKHTMDDAPVLVCSNGEISWKADVNGSRRFKCNFKEAADV